jgi:hypothetical protein
MFGMILANGQGRPQDLDGASKALSKSCKYGPEDEACSNAKQLEQLILKANKSNKK